MRWEDSFSLEKAWHLQSISERFAILSHWYASLSLIAKPQPAE